MKTYHCPNCGVKMEKIVPWVYQGDGIDTYACKYCDSGVVMNIKAQPNVKTVEFQAMVTVRTTTDDAGLDTARLQDAFIKEVFLTYQAATPGDCRKFSVAVCTD